MPLGDVCWLALGERDVFMPLGCPAGEGVWYMGLIPELGVVSLDAERQTSLKESWDDVERWPFLAARPLGMDDEASMAHEGFCSTVDLSDS